MHEPAKVKAQAEGSGNRPPSREGLSRGEKVFKWVVYSLLIINFGLYLAEDIGNAAHTLHAGSSLFDITAAFALSSGVLAWLLLIFLLELETYALDDEAWTSKVILVVHGLRIACFLVIAHFVFALVDYALELYPAQPVAGVANLCDLANRDRSWTSNLDYQLITTDNCAALSDRTAFYAIPDSPVVTDAPGLSLERQLAWGDVIEIFAWLAIILATECMVRLQERKITTGRLMVVLGTGKRVLYAVLIALALWWLWLGHPLYTWDTFLWIGGFTVIEMNLRAWREEIVHEQATLSRHHQQRQAESGHPG